MHARNDPQTVLDDPRHKAVVERDRAADGSFVFAVRTTGVYCQPSCAARLPRPENIHFFETPDAAEAAGYRACLRCRPRAHGQPDATADLMRAMADYIAAHADAPLTLQHLADQAQMSQFHFQRVFKKVIGLSPRDYQNGLRLEQFKTGLKRGDSVLDATFGAGFGSSSRVYERVNDGLGMTPSAYRAGGFGEEIAYAVRESALGPLMMAATARGVCFVQFGGDAEALRGQLASEFPQAQLRPSDEAVGIELDRWMTALDDHLSRGAPQPDLPLDLRGTAFQLKVWKFLLSVKAGEVVSYSELAKGVGIPRGARAAASACAANRIAVLVPCHRVLQANGGLGGYRWGVPRKRTPAGRGAGRVNGMKRGI